MYRRYNNGKLSYLYLTKKSPQLHSYLRDYSRTFILQASPGSYSINLSLHCAKKNVPQFVFFLNAWTRTYNDSIFAIGKEMESCQ